VLTSGFSGVRALESVLAAHPGLTCTSGTGVIPVCAQAVATWKQVENNPATMSALAASSVRALAGTMITGILAAAGGNRWCETATAPASSADTFATLFPQAQFVCFYRACAPVISAATQVSRWGLGTTGIGDFAATYPGNNVAAVAAYWCANTSALLDFEAGHSSRALRVRQEDLTASPAATTSSILQFLDLPSYQADLPGLAAETPDMTAAADLPGAGAAQIPLELIPAPMLDRVNGLHARLGYPALTRLESQPAGRAAIGSRP
jgi:protein-tyrosine sulfotransferase